MPFKTDVTESGPFASFTARDVKLANSRVIGGKIGVWINSIREAAGFDLGLEIDITNFKPDIEGGQIATASGFGFGSAGSLPISAVQTRQLDLDTTIYAANILLRLPQQVTSEYPNGRYSPYFGGGAGVARTIVGSNSPSGDAENNSPAFQGLIGGKFFITRHFALFDEYKYIYTQQKFSFDSGPTGMVHDKLAIASNNLIAGLSFHF